MKTKDEIKARIKECMDVMADHSIDLKVRSEHAKEAHNLARQLRDDQAMNEHLARVVENKP